MAISVQVSYQLGDYARARTRVRDAVKQAVVETAYQIDADAKRHVPVDNGGLKTSLHVEIGPGSGSLGVELGDMQAAVGSHLEYARAVEYGAVVPVTERSRRFFRYMALEGYRQRRKAPWSSPGPWWAFAATKKSSVRIPAQPYLGPAFHANRTRLVERVRAKLSEL